MKQIDRDVLFKQALDGHEHIQMKRNALNKAMEKLMHNKVQKRRVELEEGKNQSK